MDPKVDMGKEKIVGDLISIIKFEKVSEDRVQSHFMAA
jgi:hypothetical protein